MPTRKGPILNYTTSVEASKTALEILDLLRRHGARRVSLAYGDGQEPEGIFFEVPTRFGVRGFRVPARVEGVLEVLRKNAGKGKVTKAMVNRRHAANVAWRILKDGLEVHLAWVDVGLTTFEEVFLGQMVTGPGGEPMLDFIERQLALPRPAGAG